MDQYITTTMSAPKNPLITKAPKVNYDSLQPGGALVQRLNHDKIHWPNPVTRSGVAFQLCI